MFTTNASRGLPRHRSRHVAERYSRWAMRSLIGLMVLALLWLVMAFYMHGQWVFALLFLVLGTSLGVVFSRRSLMSHRYIFPAVAGLGVFVIFPLVYTVGISFSNYSSDNLLSQERVRAQLTNQTYQAEGAAFSYSLYQAGELVRLYLESDAPAGDNDRLLSAALNLTNSEVRRVPTQAVDGPPEGEPLPMRAAIQARDALQALRLQTPGGTELRMAGLRQFAPMIDRYEIRDNGSLYDRQEDQVLTPDNDIGFFVTENGERITPGWPVNVGASLLQWDQLKGKAVYRTLLILPYAVPAFISILIFKGMFNQHFGEVNMILEALFGISPEWFTDPWLARTMLLIVNTWLGYPYMLLLCMGLIQSIPGDLYEASAVDGGGPITNLMKITLPLIIKPLTPLLIAAFAFNFNNFVLIALLTGGSPDILGASTPAGTTDLLVSYTYRIAFQDAGQNFGLAAAIATLIFLLVVGMSVINLRLSKVKV